MDVRLLSGIIAGAMGQYAAFLYQELGHIALCLFHAGCFDHFCHPFANRKEILCIEIQVLNVQELSSALFMNILYMGFLFRNHK